MFKAGDIVKYGVNGICKVTDVIMRDFLGEQMEYYVLAPLATRDSTFFVPTKNEVLTSRMQHILSEAEVYKLIGDIPDCHTEWIDNDKSRAEAFGKILTSKDRHDIIALIRTIKSKKAELEQNGKKLHAADERILNDADRIISEEFSAVLGIKPREVAGFIDSIIENK